MKSYSFTVPGNPLPKQRARVTKRGTFTPQATRNAEQVVAFFALKAGIKKPLLGRLHLAAKFYRQNNKRCDLDNLVKLLTDALNGRAFDDDSQIVSVEASKVVDKDKPRTEITIVEIEEAPF